MPTGAITQYIDVAQLVLYAFWAFFAGLVYYLHRENKREGYPLELEGGGRVIAQGFPPIPAPKSYLLRNGDVILAPHPSREVQPEIQVTTFARHPGTPLEPAGDPMTSGAGPGAHALRPDTPDLTAHGEARIVPMRIVDQISVDVEDTDPRGRPVIGCDGAVGGVVRDLWVDRAEMLFRYLEVEVTGGRTALLPMGFARIKPRGVYVNAITSTQFAGVPQTSVADRITMLEEERVMAYYGAGKLYATPSRAEPLL